jgi:hypothetical protein
MDLLWSSEIKEDPLAFVMLAFPWGEEGTPLAKEKGPRTWQKEILLEIKEHIRNNQLRMEMGEEPLLFQSAVSSGRGIGKSSLVAWLNLWMMTCNLGSTTVVTANTEDQLKSKTWAELGKVAHLGDQFSLV